MKAPAKINLYLRVVGTRSNGYHDIESVLVPVSLWDALDFELTDGPVETTVERNHRPVTETPLPPRTEDNLTTRAAVRLKEHCGYSGGARIRLAKHIPVGGGLGGGSSDAAAVLHALNALWDLGCSVEELMAIGFELGCDIPAMVRGGAVRISGLGEQVAPLKTRFADASRRWWLVVANPCFSVSTRDIYARYDSALTSTPIAASSVITALEEGDLDLAAKGLFNDLQDTVFRKYPIIRMLAECLVEAGAIGVSLSGSGASLFGLARDREHAAAIERRVCEAARFPVWCKAVQTLPDGVMVAHGPLEA